MKATVSKADRTSRTTVVESNLGPGTMSNRIRRKALLKKLLSLSAIGLFSYPQQYSSCCFAEDVYINQIASPEYSTDIPSVSEAVQNPPDDSRNLKRSKVVHYVPLIDAAVKELWATRLNTKPNAGEVSELNAVDLNGASERWKTGVLCEDSTFLRRIYLDLIGRIPSVSEAKVFLADSSANKRETLIDKLLESPEYVRNTALFWRRVWLPQTDGPGSGQLGQHFDGWFADQVQRGSGYDDVVRGIMSLPAREVAREVEFDRYSVASSIFVAVGESQPATLAANTTRAFLGLNLDCAQCHDHPFAAWSQNQFWQTAAFFTSLAPALPSDSEEAKKPALPANTLSIHVDGTDKIVHASFLDDQVLTVPEKVEYLTGPDLLASWITKDSNPYLVRHAVNRLWTRYCGAGLINPIDDISNDPGPEHAKILALLEQAFREVDLDFRMMDKLIVSTIAYQQSSESYSLDAPNPEDFLRHPIRALTGEQIFDSVQIVAGKSLPTDKSELREFNEMRRKFSVQFPAERPEATLRSIPQALTLMNGKLIEEASALDHSALTQSMTAPFLNDEERVEYLYLSVFARYPTNIEKTQLMSLLESISNSERDQSLANMIWAMLNSTEFSTNH